MFRFITNYKLRLKKSKTLRFTSKKNFFYILMGKYPGYINDNNNIVFKGCSQRIYAFIKKKLSIKAVTRITALKLVIKACRRGSFSNSCRKAPASLPWGFLQPPWQCRASAAQTQPESWSGLRQPSAVGCWGSWMQCQWLPWSGVQSSWPSEKPDAKRQVHKNI